MTLSRVSPLVERPKTIIDIVPPWEFGGSKYHLGSVWIQSRVKPGEISNFLSLGRYPAKAGETVSAFTRNLLPLANNAETMDALGQLGIADIFDKPDSIYRRVEFITHTNDGSPGTVVRNHRAFAL